MRNRYDIENGRRAKSICWWRTRSQALAFLLSSAIWRMFSRTPATFGLSKSAFSRTPNDTGHLDLASFASLSKSETNCAQPSEGELVSSVGTSSRYSVFLYSRTSEESCASFFPKFSKIPPWLSEIFSDFWIKGERFPPCCSQLAGAESWRNFRLFLFFPIEQPALFNPRSSIF